MNVVVGHGLFPIATEHFGPDRISVEFFFILSGFLFYRSLPTIKEMRVRDAIIKTVIPRLKPLAVPMIIGLASNAVLNYLSSYKPMIEIFRYLWYIPAMLITMAVFAIMRSLIKSDKLFFGILIVLCVIATAMRYSGSSWMFYFDYIRSTASISLGILIAKLPQPKFKKKFILPLLLLPVVAATFTIIYLGLAVEQVKYEALTDLVLYPILIYLSFGIDLHFAPFDYLGSLSFGIYAFQCPARLVAFIGVPSRWIPFCLIFVLTLVENTAKRIIMAYKKKKNNTLKA